MEIGSRDKELECHEYEDKRELRGRVARQSAEIQKRSWEPMKEEVVKGEDNGKSIEQY